MAKEKILNPYAERKGSWVKGNLHTHSNKSKNEGMELNKVMDLYNDCDYDFIAITDYDTVTEVSEKYKDLLVIKGYESTKYSHILCIGTNEIVLGTPQEIINNNSKNGGISILCHPNWQRWDYWSTEEMEKLENYTGIEIYDSVINRMVGSSEAFEEWDYLLSIGKKVWGFANDDFHSAEDINKAWNVVRVNNLSKESIIRSLKNGNFYTSTGVEIFDIYAENGKFIIESDADKIRFISGGRTISEVLSSKAVFNISDFTGYIRAEAINEDGSRAWSQPIFKV